MALDNTYQPPSNYPLRPLNKGMIRNLPPNGIPQGSFLRLQNYRVHEYGLKRRSGLVPFNLNNGSGETATYDEQLLDLIYYWSSSVTPEMLLLGAENLMKISTSGSVSKVYANGPDNLFLLGSIGAYNSATYTIALTYPCTGQEASRMYVGAKAFFDVSGTVKYFGPIVSVSYSDPDITIEVNVGLSDPVDKPIASTDSIIVRETFISSPKMDVSFGVFPAETYEDTGKVLIADQGGNGLYSYDSGALNTFVTDSGVISGEGTQYFDSARVITYFEDRAFTGNTLEQGIRFPQRIRWSDPVKYDRFQPGNYVDLPYGDGELLNLVPLGSLLAAYYSDAIYIGRPTNIAGRPYKFERLETGTMGLINQRAIVPWADGHYFVGTDNIYFIGMNQAKPTPIGSPVLAETLEYSKFLDQGDNIQVQHDSQGESIVFLFPDITEDSVASRSVATKLWRLNYKTMGWSYDEVHYTDIEKTDPSFYYTGLLPSRYYTSGMSWEDWQEGDDEDTELSSKSWMPVKTDETIYPGAISENPGTTITDPLTDIADSSIDLADTFWNSLTWDALKSEGITTKKLYLPIWRRTGGSQLIVEESPQMEQDNLGETDPVDDTETLYPIWTVIESQDFDFGAPDTSKTITRFGCKIFDNQIGELRDEVKSILAELTFDLHMSDSMGYKWKRPITFGFKSNYNEGFANFRATGSTFRFKLISAQQVPPYKLSEMTLRVVGRGLQVTN